MDPTITVALIGLAGLTVSAIVNGWVLLKISHVQTNVQKIETATNSMKDELVRLSRAEGKQEGKDEVHAEAHMMAAATAVPVRLEVKLDNGVAETPKPSP